MISTNNLNNLPNYKILKNLCKSISVLEAIISQDFEYRYYSYNNNWSKDLNGFSEEFFQMRNGEGDEFQILFGNNNYCIINGYSKKFKNNIKIKESIPEKYKSFIFDEPIKTIGTSYSIWLNENNCWETAFWSLSSSSSIKTTNIEINDDGSSDQLFIFNIDPQIYIDFANDYYEDGIKETGIPLETVQKIYNHEPLTKEMVLSIVSNLDDWEKLKKDLNEIGYQYNF